MGTKAAAATAPVHSGLWDRAVTTTPSATACIHEPTLDTSAELQTRAKFLERSGRSEVSTVRRGYRRAMGADPATRGLLLERATGVDSDVGWRLRTGRGMGRSTDGPACDGLEPARRLLAQSTRTVVLTGAGISTDSGIPDFRGPNGVWTKNPAAEKMATLQTYMTDPDVRRRAWRNRLESPTWEAEPNAGHRALVALERRGVLHTLVTQNVDGLHQAAGNDPGSGGGDPRHHARGGVHVLRHAHRHGGRARPGTRRRGGPPLHGRTGARRRAAAS